MKPTLSMIFYQICLGAFVTFVLVSICTMVALWIFDWGQV